MSRSSVLNDYRTKALIKTMDLERPSEFIEISDYNYNGTSIEIVRANVVDVNGKFKREANLKKLLPHLKNMNVNFL